MTSLDWTGRNLGRSHLDGERRGWVDNARATRSEHATAQPGRAGGYNPLPACLLAPWNAHGRRRSRSWLLTHHEKCVVSVFTFVLSLESQCSFYGSLLPRALPCPAPPLLSVSELLWRRGVEESRSPCGLPAARRKRWQPGRPMPSKGTISIIFKARRKKKASVMNNGCVPVIRQASAGQRGCGSTLLACLDCACQLHLHLHLQLLACKRSLISLVSNCGLAN